MPSGTNTAVVYTPRFYPTLSSVVSEDQIPDILGFIKDGLFLILNKVHYKDLQYNKSINGDAAFYSLSIVAKDRLDFKIPSTEIFIVLNPDVDGADDAISAFPITIEYEWKVLGYLRGFQLNQFDFSPRTIFDMALRILNISEEQALANFINIFAEADATTTSLQRFVNDVNTELNTTLTTPTNETTLTEVAQEIYVQTDNYASVAAFSTYILHSSDAEQTKAKLKLYFRSFLPQDIEEFVKDILIPKFRATLMLSAAIEFPRKVLQPVYPLGHANAYEVIPEDPNDNFLDKVQLSFGEALFYADTEQGLGYNMDVAINTSAPAMIGKTGLILNINNVKIDLSRTQNIAEATALGRPNDFIGAYINEATIALPEKWFKQQNGTTAQIYARNLLVGTGGVSGNIGLEAAGAVPPGQEPELKLKLGSNSGFEVALNRFNVAFQQNSIISSDIKGSITIPNFKELDDNDDVIPGDLKLGVMMHFDNEGDFSITAIPNTGRTRIGIKDVFAFNVSTFTVGREDDRFYVALSGGLDILADFGSDDEMFPLGLEIPKLIIWEDGSFEIPTDAPPFPSEIRLRFKPVELYLSNMHIGSYEKNGRPYKYFGFDGGIKTDPTSVDAKGTGIKIYFSVDDKALDIFIRIQRIDIDLIIPAKKGANNAALILKGYLAMRDGGGGTTEYAGGVSISLPKLDIKGSAAMRLNPQKPNFIVDAELEMGQGLPLASTGLSIYGFRGLVGNNYVATKEAAKVNEDDPWWKYYKAPPQDGVHVDKFDGDMEGFSLGAGVSLATTPDNGKAFSSKLFFLLSLPNVFLFEGKAAILQKRIGLDDTTEPPFFALLSVDDTSIEAAIGVDYKMPDHGQWFKKIAQLNGVLELGFFRGDASAWYVNIGRDMPEDMRVQANIADLFNAYAYLMLSAKRIKAGAGIGFEKEYSLARKKKRKNRTIGLTFNAYIDVAAQINFSPQQFGGSLAMGGSLTAKVLGFSASMSADALLAGETPEPYIIIGKVKVEFKIIWSFDFEFELEWTKNPNPSDKELPILTASEDALGNLPAKATNILTKAEYPLAYSTGSAIPSPDAWKSPVSDFVIPLDSYIDFEFAKTVKPFTQGDSTLKIGGVTTGYRNTEVFPPQKAKTTQLRHTYEIDNISVKYWNGDKWEDYEVYKALTSLVDLPFINPSDLENKNHGYWQMHIPERYNKLRVLAQTPITYTQQAATPTPLEEFGITYETLFCEDEQIKHHCQRWEKEDKSVIYLKNQIIAHKNMQWRVNKDSGVGNIINPFDVQQSLKVVDGGTIDLFFYKTIMGADIKMTTEVGEIQINYYKRTQKSVEGQAPVMVWQLLQQEVKTKTELAKAIHYKNTKEGFDRIEIIVPDNIPQPHIDHFPQNTYVHEVCWQTVENYLFNQTIVNEPDVQAEADALINGLNKIIQPIWRPNTAYVIQVKVLDRLTEAHDKVYETYHNFGFKTAGPIGHFHENDKRYTNLPIEQKDQYMLSDLRSYVDYTKSYPNADGNLLQAKPLFYEHPKLSLFFVKPYVYTMFNNFDKYKDAKTFSSKLSAVVKDPTDQPNNTSSGTSKTEAKWRETRYGIVEQDILMINNLIINGKPCVKTTKITPPNVAADLIPDTLKPLKNYTAIINSEFDKSTSEVLRYVFETSRYPDFKSQIGSYQLSDNRQAIYNIELKDVDTKLIKDVFNDAIAVDDKLRRDFANQFDRLLFTMQLGAMEVPMNTEFNIIRFEKQILGVLVKSPEPFNDPKIPVDIIRPHFEFYHSLIRPKGFKVLTSKDGASMFISIEALDIPSGELMLNIPYMEYDGQQYRRSSNRAHQAPNVVVKL